MDEFKNHKRFAVSLAAVMLVMLVVTGVSIAGEQPKAAPAPTVGGDYVGSDICISCHDDQNRRMKNTVMGKAFAKPHTADEKLGCESCHGPGRVHVEAGGSKETIPIRYGKDTRNSVEEQNQSCVQCHKRGNRMFWAGSPHESRGMRCVDCHNVKQQLSRSMAGEAFLTEPLKDTGGLVKPETELCLQCHQMRRAQLQRSSHMPFREGKVTCTSCHNPHGSPNPSQLKQATVNENCYSCHAERRGPFLWAHPPVTENCDTCHEAHGSTNPQLLKTRIPRLCQQCHNEFAHGTGTIGYPLGNVSNSAGKPMGYPNKTTNRGCANCHSKIHGTNAPSGKFFVR
jgi:DmsE family decaheme c-type cytochrome